MWTVVYVASGWTEAERIKDILTREGLLVMLRTTCTGRDGRGREVELLVPEIEAREAHCLIMQIKGAARV
ncbi:MAG: glutamate decarboxylase [Firmicutes bacterium]|nr:glutamate decarboxylase [Candidatus Fermentithermobacillaceae bacterium]